MCVEVPSYRKLLEDFAQLIEFVEWLHDVVNKKLRRYRAGYPAGHKVSGQLRLVSALITLYPLKFAVANPCIGLHFDKLGNLNP